MSDLTDFVEGVYDPLKAAHDRIMRQVREAAADFTALGIPDHDRDGRLLTFQGRLRVFVFRMGRRMVEASAAIERFQETQDEQFLQDALALLRSPDAMSALVDETIESPRSAFLESR